MTAPFPRALGSAALLALLGLAVAGCQGGPAGRGGRGQGGGSQEPAATPGGMSPTLMRERDERFFRVDAMIQQWDAAQVDGQEELAAGLAVKIGQETDADWPIFVQAARGEVSVAAQSLAVKALGFSKNPQATAILVERLQSDDAPLVGNALIALKLRSDPSTSLPPIIRLLRSSAKDIRRYAPLALANVLLARERIGRSLEPALARDAMTGLVALVQDRDPFVRLHAAKAMGALRLPDAVDFLVLLLKDEYVKIRIAAAAGLERLGDPRAFPQVIALLAAVDAAEKEVVAEILVSYAQKITGRPLTPEQRAALDVSPRAWDRWYSERDRGSSSSPPPPAPAPAPAPAPFPSASSLPPPPPPPPPVPLPAPR